MKDNLNQSERNIRNRNIKIIILWNVTLLTSIINSNFSHLLSQLSNNILSAILFISFITALWFARPHIKKIIKNWPKKLNIDSEDERTKFLKSQAMSVGFAVNLLSLGIFYLIAWMPANLFPLQEIITNARFVTHTTLLLTVSSAAITYFWLDEQ
ncbi:MAG: hypothetical protein HRU28_10755 [Rhizobiales bacterium]|nr:hypothetical protein [Hyphomicrobiales bacterium]